MCTTELLAGMFISGANYVLGFLPKKFERMKFKSVVVHIITVTC